MTENKTLDFQEAMISRFFLEDRIDLSKHPDKTISDAMSLVSNPVLDVSSLGHTIKGEIKIFIRDDANRVKDKVSIDRLFLVPVRKIIDFLSKEAFDSIIDIPFDYFEEKIKDVPDNGYVRGAFARMQRAVWLEYDKNIPNYFDRNIWVLEDIIKDKKRFDLSKAGELKFFDFIDIDNLDNRNWMKKYFHHLVLTDLAVSSIKNSYYILKTFCLTINSVPFTNITRENIAQYIAYLTGKKYFAESYNRRLFIVKDFLSYIKTFAPETSIPIYDKDFIRIKKRRFKESAVSDYVLFQMLARINELPENIKLMYLINVCTGIRISEVCLLELGCVREENEFFALHYYCQKMRKEGYTYIPSTLASMILEYEKTIIGSQEKSKYLFSASDGKPITTKAYSNKMKEYCGKWEIINQDGTLYDFKSHDYRHRVAKILVEDDVSIFTIAKVLNHESSRMTQSYAEVRDSLRKEQFSKFVKTVDEKKLTDAEITSEWLRDNLEKAALPNGFCTLPCQMECPDYNGCLHCTSFVTSKEFLPVHKRQLSVLKESLPEYEANGWKTKIATAKKDISKLKEIITMLEG